MHKTQESLEAAIGYTFNNPALAQPFITPDMPRGVVQTHERKVQLNRMALLGDSIAFSIISPYLDETLVHIDTRSRGKLKDQLNGNDCMAAAAKRLGLCEEGISTHRGGTYLEALVSAIFQDGGLAPVKTFLENYVETALPLLSGQTVDIPARRHGNAISQSTAFGGLRNSVQDKVPGVRVRKVVVCDR